MAELNPQPLPPLRGSIHINVAETVKLDDLHKIITEAVALSGCRTCGLLGIDIRLIGDPVVNPTILKIHGVKSASVVR